MALDPANTVRRMRLIVACVIACALFASPASAVSFNRVVSLGDSLLDDGGGSRSPVVSQHIAQRLGVPLTRLAVSGATTTSLISGGQHTTAAANFGPGDLAVLWIGGNDFAAIGAALAIGNFSGLNAIEANVDVILATLRAAGMDVVVFNLFDLATVPSVLDQFPAALLPNGTAAAVSWRTRIAALGAAHGAAVVDVFTLYPQLQASPASFAIAGTPPVLAPSRGSKATCPLCIWRDSIHPSSLGQGYIANQAFAAINAFFDPQSAAPLALLGEAELIALAGTFTPATVTPTATATVPATATPTPTATVPATATATATPDLAATCPPVPQSGCAGASRARLEVRESQPGRESIKVQLGRFANATGQADFGDPVDGITSYAVCVYDDALDRVVELRIDRAGDLCGSRPCWSAVADRGFRFADRDGTSNGITRVLLSGGGAGRGTIRVDGRNRVSGPAALPTGVAAALAGTSAATLQVLGRDATCFTAELDTVMRAGATQFTAVLR